MNGLMIILIGQPAHADLRDGDRELMLTHCPSNGSVQNEPTDHSQLILLTVPIGALFSEGMQTPGLYVSNHGTLAQTGLFATTLACGRTGRGMG